MVSKPTLIIDTKERELQWDFDGDNDFLDIKHYKMKTGDYTLEGYEHLITIERKASPDELFANFGDAKVKARLHREARRMVKMPHKFVIVECTLDEIASPASYYVNRAKRNRQSPFMPPAVVIQNLNSFMLDYDIHVIFAGLKGKSIAKKILLGLHERYQKGHLNVEAATHKSQS